MPTARDSAPLIPTEIVPSIARSDLGCAAVEREFSRLVDDGAPIRIAGRAKRHPKRLLSQGYRPKHKLELFDTRFYLTNVRQNPELRFLLAWVVQPNRRSGRPEIFPRIFYKDLSLVWRSASHFSNGDGLWVGKGDVEIFTEGGEEFETSRESTTDLPLEMQTALESLIHWIRRVPSDEKILGMVLHEAPEDRVRPYADFTDPRRRAEANPRNLIHGGRPIARFTRAGDPGSLRIVAGYEPDFDRGVLETARFKSRLYGGTLRRFRIVSKNRRIQYGFFAGPKHVWIVPPQATTTELSSYGVRTVDVIADDDLFLPGYEYHYVIDENGGQPILHSQIPKGFVGPMCPHDDQKADASPWLDRIPVIREFRRKVLRRKA